MPSSLLESSSRRALIGSLGGTLAIVFCCLSVVRVVRAEPWGAGVEPPSAPKAWEIHGGDGQWQLISHERQGELESTKTASETFRLHCGHGTYLYLIHRLPEGAAIIPELQPRVWIKADRPGLQLMARIVFPGSVDSRTGQPVTALIRGETYQQADRWQVLGMGSIPMLVERQLEVLRAQLGRPIDGRHAYMDMLVVNAYGGAGATSLSLSDPKITGRARAYLNPSSNSPRSAAGQRAPSRVMPIPTTARTRADVFASSQQPVASRPDLQGGVLRAHGHPFFPLIIEYQGESFADLAGLGFNTVQLSQPPTVAQCESARQHKLWIIAPPPPNIATAALDHDVLLAWFLGRDLTSAQLEPTGSIANELRRLPIDQRHLLIGAPVAGLNGHSRHLDILVHERLPLGTGLDVTGYRQWLSERPNLYRAGIPCWAVVQTEPHPALLRQCLAAGIPATSAAVEADQVRQLAYAAASAGARGLIFQSQSPLNVDRPSNRLRRAVLQQLNFELSLLQSWLAQSRGTLTIETSSSDTVAAVFSAPRAHAVIPFHLGTQSQFVARRAPTGPLQLVIPPDLSGSGTTLELLATGFRSPAQRRVTGGTRITLDAFQNSAMIVCCDQPAVIAHLDGRMRSARRAISDQQRTIAALSLAMTESTVQQLLPLAPTLPEAAKDLEAARAQLVLCDQRLAARDFVAAEQYAHQTMYHLSQTRFAYWQQATEGFPQPSSSPFCGHFDLLPSHWRLSQTLRAASYQDYPLRGSDFESLDELIQTGWRYSEQSAPDLETKVSLTPELPQHGGFALRMACRPLRPEAGQSVLESPPVWLESPPVAVPAGQLVHVRGFVRIEQPIRGSQDGFLIVDSLGGPALAQRLVTGKEWQPFSVFRVGDQSGEIRLTFALTGMGQVALDHITIQVATLARPDAASIAP